VTADANETEPGPIKLDPETLVLRGKPGRVVRFRRSAIVSVAAIGSVVIVAAAWMGLSPPTFRMVVAADKFETPPPPDELANAPKGYGDIPQLGPPLPGDLGRPIVAHQRAGMATESGGNAAAEAEQAERQRAVAEVKAARESAVLMQVSNGRTGRSSEPAALAPIPESPEPSRSEAVAERDPNGQTRKNEFLKRVSDSPDINPHDLVPSPSPYNLAAGSILSASLITGLNSDVPGFVTAQVTENAYDTATGMVLLVPQGARLIGRYDSVVAFGQSRALVVWERILFPDGSSIRIDNMPATDASGYAGLTDKIDRHSWQILKGVGLSTLLGIGTELSLGSSESDLVAAIRQSAQLSGARAGDQLVGKSLDIQPTIRVRPGWPLRIVVHKDIVLRPWRGLGG
jgi:type IV secretion system protein VirB10